MMSADIGDVRRGRDCAAVVADREGAATVEFAFVAPLLVALTAGILELTGFMFDYHMAGETARRGARTAAIVLPVADTSSLSPGIPVVCAGSADGPQCSGAGVAASGSFDVIVEDMRRTWSRLGPENVIVEYRFSGIGSADRPGGILPMVTIRLVGLSRSFSLAQVVPGMAALTGFPAFASSHLGNGQ